MPKYLFDLLWHDGPYCSIYLKENGYLELWDYKECVNDCTIWNIITISKEPLVSYLIKEITFGQLLKTGHTFKQVGLHELTKTFINSITMESALPKDDYYYDEIFSPHSIVEIEKFVYDN